MESYPEIYFCNEAKFGSLMGNNPITVGLRDSQVHEKIMPMQLPNRGVTSLHQPEKIKFTKFQPSSKQSRARTESKQEN